MNNERTESIRAFSKPAREYCNRSSKRLRKAFTLIEMTVTAAISVIVVLGVGFMVADGQRAWHQAYENVNADVVTDGFVARRVFDSAIRKGGSTTYTVSDNGDWFEVEYYNDLDAVQPDRYVRFYRAGNTLVIEDGVVDPRELLRSRTVCGNVTECTFKVSGRAAQMILFLDDGERTGKIVACGYMHN